MRLIRTLRENLFFLAAGEAASRVSTLGSCRCYYFVGGFFFQAEDGIRDYKVTGVQTCVLPISAQWRVSPPPKHAPLAGRLSIRQRRSHWRGSEERRVGQECRSRWSPDH